MHVTATEPGIDVLISSFVGRYGRGVDASASESTARGHIPSFGGQYGRGVDASASESGGLDSASTISAVGRRYASSRFVAREPEMAALAGAFARADAREPSMVLITGDAGIGKTRLVTEFLATLDARVLAGTCAPIGDDGPPYGPLLGALRDFGALPTEAAGAAEGGQVGRARLLEAVLNRLESESTHRAIVVVVEDLQWSDRSTRDLLDFCIRCLPPSRVLFVGTVRTDELERDHPILPFLVEISRQPRMQRIDVGALDADAAAELVSAMTDLPSSSSVVAEIVGRGGGMHSSSKSCRFRPSRKAARIDPRDRPGANGRAVARRDARACRDGRPQRASGRRPVGRAVGPVAGRGRRRRSGGHQSATPHV